MLDILITITNYLFRQNRTRNITITHTCTKIPKLQRSCQLGDCTEDIMTASIQPPVIFLKLNQKNYRLK